MKHRGGKLPTVWSASTFAFELPAKQKYLLRRTVWSIFLFTHSQLDASREPFARPFPIAGLPQLSRSPSLQV